MLDPKKLLPYAGNPRRNDQAVKKMVKVLKKFGFRIPVLALSNGDLIDGHLRIKAAAKLKLKEIPVIYCDDLSAEDVKALRLSVNKAAEFAEWDEDLLAGELEELSEFGIDLDEIGFGDFQFSHGDEDEEDDGSGTGKRAPMDKETAKATLAERFGVAPFSVLNAREGYWQNRKRAWIGMGIKSELGRGDGEFHAAPGGSVMVSGYGPNGERLTGLKNISVRSRTSNGKRKAATFGQDLMRGEHSVGKTAKGEKDSTKYTKGVLLPARTVADPDFYRQKEEAEKTLGKKLTTDEFLAEHYKGPIGKGKAKSFNTTDWMKDKGLSGGCSDGDEGVASGTSIFDPVLTELSYRWFSPVNGTILDPFAGGSVRGVVAAKLGRRYLGHELRAEQVEANRKQGKDICSDCDFPPVWKVGDSQNIRTSFKGEKVDMVFSCPPYADLEVYSDDPADLSTMPYEKFIEIYRKIIAESVAMLKDNRFACFVVGDVRDKKGNYRNFVGDTVQAFLDAGMELYNEAILVTSAGSLPIRVGKQFTTTRKLGKTHQNILVFVKGDAKLATKACGEVEFGEIEAVPQEHSDLGEEL
jgi:hypothetical protein